MGNVVSFAEVVAAKEAAKQAEAAKANESVEIALSDEDCELRSSPEGTALLEALSKQGINIINEESLRDFRTVMRLVRGMKDRQAGNHGSEDCAILECMAQALHYGKEPIHDDSFDDLLGKLD